jgi:DNA-directed RNA polymerase subunit M/transcription elongation factor TFIIS
MDYPRTLPSLKFNSRITFKPMPIEFSCNNCNKLLRVPDGSEGKPCQCPSCRAVATVPSRPMVSATSPVSAPKVDDGKVSVRCPQCQYSLRCAPELMGTKGQCKQCKHIFVIGETQSAEPQKSTLVFSCPKCSQLFDGKPEMAGRKGRCHACGEVFKIELREMTTDDSLSLTLGQPMEKLSTPKSKPSPTTASATQSKPIFQTAPAIQLICGSCSGGLEVPGTAAGQTTACPHCGQLLQVPSNEADEIVEVVADDEPPTPVSPQSVPQKSASTGSSNLFDFGAPSSSSTSSPKNNPQSYPQSHPQANSSSPFDFSSPSASNTASPSHYAQPNPQQANNSTPFDFAPPGAGNQPGGYAPYTYPAAAQPSTSYANPYATTSHSRSNTQPIGPTPPLLYAFPGIVIAISGAWELLIGSLGLLTSYNPQILIDRSDIEPYERMFGAVVFLFLGLTCLTGGILIALRKSLLLCRIAAIIACIPCTGCLCMNFPFGIWACVMVFSSNASRDFASS